jgi:hypothetical protein
MVETSFMKLYERLGSLNGDSSLNEKWYKSEDYDGRVWFSDSAVQFKNFMKNLSSSGMKDVRLVVAPDFYLVANAADFNHDMMVEIAEDELYLESPAEYELTTCGIPKCTDFELENYELEDLKQEAEDDPEDENFAQYLNYDPEKDYQGLLIADYGTFELSLYNFLSKAHPNHVPKYKGRTHYFEDSETYRVLKPLLKRIYVYGE